MREFEPARSRDDAELAEEIRADAEEVEIVGGERRLLYAMLVNAIESYRKAGARSPWTREYLEARRWLFADANGDFFSFTNVCEMLGIDPLRLRRRLRETTSVRSAFSGRHGASMRGARRQAAG